MNLTEISLRKPVFAWMIMFSFIFFGANAFNSMGISELPDVDFPVVNVSVTWEGAAAEVIELDVVDVLESSLISVEGAKSLSSRARRGQGNVSIEFDLDKNIDVAVQEVQTILSQIQRRLPTDIDPPIVSKVNPEDRPIMWMAITAKETSRRDLMAYVRDNIRDRFTSLTGVSDVILGGYIEPNVRVWLRDDDLKKYDLSSVDVVSAIAREHSEQPGGLYETPDKEFSVRMLGEAPNVSQFEKIIINSRGGRPIYTPITIGDVARVEDDLDDVRRISRVMGESAVGLGIRKIRGTNTVEIADAVKKEMEIVRSILPDDMDIGVNYDSTVFIKDSIKELYKTLILSGILTSLVCWLFLGSFGATINIMLSIPTAIVGSFIALTFFGFTLNTFTLLGLTLAVGLVVDDNIMILENITRYFKIASNRVKASLFGTKEVTFAAVAAAVAIVAIFLPVGFMDGVIGKYFFEFAVTISVAVTFSLVDAVTLTPMRAAKLMKSKNVEGIGPVRSLMAFLTRYYTIILAKSLNWRWSVLISSLVFFAGTLFFFKELPKEFSPAQDQGRLVMRVVTPLGSSLEYTDNFVKKVEQVLLKEKNVERFFMAIGGFGGGESNAANGFITLKSFFDRDVDPELGKRPSQVQMAGKLRKVLATVEGGRVFVQDPSQSGIGGRRGYPVEFNIKGGDWEKLFELAQEFIKRINESGIMTDGDSNFQGKVPELHVIPDREKALARGVSVEEIGRVVRTTVSGVVAGKFSRDGRRYDIRVKLDDDSIQSVDDIKKLQVRNNRGELIEIGEICEVTEEQGLQTIFREDRARAIGVYANISEGGSQGEAIAYIEKLAEEILPPGYILEQTGSSQVFQESFSSLLFVFMIGLVVAYIVLASQFNSFIQPIVILMALPFSISGAFIALWLTGQTLNIYSMIGMILLMGIVKKNSIILVDFTNQLRQQGKTIREALEEACPIRLRPIFMTSVSTVAGALPAALTAGPGSEIRIPMAFAVIGGVLVSTLLTLFVVPAFYSLVSREGEFESGLDEDDFVEDVKA